MDQRRRGVVAFTALAGAAVVAALFWASNDPDRVPMASAAEVPTNTMGAGPAPAEPAGPPAGMWERFETEKRQAPVSELPAQF